MQRDIKAALKQGQVLIGSFFRLPSPDLVEIFGEAGFDFIIIDQEHGPRQPGDNVESGARLRPGGNGSRRSHPGQSAVDLSACTGRGRVGCAGATGQKRSGCRASGAGIEIRAGGESGCLPQRSCGALFGRDRYVYLEGSNRDTVVVIQIESKEGVENIEAILGVPGIDVIFLGPYDLSQSLGIPGQVDHPMVWSTMEGVVSACRSAGVAAGVYADSVEAVRHWAGLGVQYIAVGIDTALIYNLTRKLVSELRP